MYIKFFCKGVKKRIRYFASLYVKLLNNPFLKLSIHEYNTKKIIMDLLPFTLNVMLSIVSKK